MVLHVSIEVFFYMEAFAAHWTGERLLPGVYPHVSGHVSSPAEVLPTEKAAVGLFPSVASHVSRQGAAVFECLITACTRERPLAGVVSDVSVQISLQAKTFPTIGAWKWALLCRGANITLGDFAEFLRINMQTGFVGV